MKTLITICLLFGFTTIYAQSYEVNTNNSSFSWTGKAAFSSYALTGEIKVKKGTVVIDEDQISKLIILMDMKSLNHKNSDLKGHLRSEDFFEVSTYKTAKFEMKEVSRIENNKAKLKGELTIKDITRIETFIINIDNNQSKITLDIVIDRTAYDVKFNSPSFFKKLKENAIADEFILKGEILLK